jgi:hypothetical protein
LNASGIFFGMTDTPRFGCAAHPFGDYKFFGNGYRDYNKSSISLTKQMMRDCNHNFVTTVVVARHPAVKITRKMRGPPA